MPLPVITYWLALQLAFSSLNRSMDGTVNVLIDGFNKQLRGIRWKCPGGIAFMSKAVCKHSFSFIGSQVNWTILRNVSAATTMSDTWKTQRNSLKISLTTDEGEEVSTEGEGKGRFVCHVNFLCVIVLIYRMNTWFRHRSVILTRKL